MNRAAQPGGWKIADYYNQAQRTRTLAKTQGLGYRIRSYRQSAYFPSFAGGTSLSIGRAKIVGISTILIGLILGGYLVYQSSAFHSYTHVGGPDPYTVLWAPTNSSTVFKHNTQSSYTAAIGCSDNPYRCETLQSSQTITAQQDTECTSGSRFICGQSNSIGFATPNHSYILQTVLNFTGSGSANGVNTCNASGFGPACSYIQTGDFDSSNTTVTTSSIF